MRYPNSIDRQAISIHSGMSLIASANYQGFSEIAAAIEHAGYEQAKAMEKVAKSNFEIARGIFSATELMNEGLTRILDELERKRKADEYYLLLDRIDSLEDKIISCGASLEKVYDKLNLHGTKELINLSYGEIVFLLDNIPEKTRTWLKCASNYFKEHPFNIIYKLLDEDDFDLILMIRDYYKDENTLDLVLRGSFLGHIYLGSIMEEEFNFDEAVLSNNMGKIIRKDNKVYYQFGEKLFNKRGFKEIESTVQMLDYIREQTSRWNAVWLDSDTLTKVELVKRAVEFKKNNVHNKYAATETQMMQISELEDDFSRVNCEIMLTNLRILHNELLSAYKALKFEMKVD